MTKNTATSTSAHLANEAGYDPIEDRLRLNIRAVTEAVFEEELDQFPGRCRYGRSGEAKAGYRHGHPLPGSASTGCTRGGAADKKGRGPDRLGLPFGHQHAAGEAGAVRPVSRRGQQGRGQPGLVQLARKVQTDWQAWCARSLADEDIVRLILGGTVIKTRIDKKATNISPLMVCKQTTAWQ